jgi:hypothetical protein
MTMQRLRLRAADPLLPNRSSGVDHFTAPVAGPPWAAHDVCGEGCGMNFFAVMGGVLIVVLLVAALVDYRRRKLGDTRSGRAIATSVKSQKDARKRGERWGTGQDG